MLSRLPALSLVALGAFLLVTVAAALHVAAADQPAGKDVDWSGLDALLVAGDYERAIAAADEIASAIKPKPRDPDFLPQSIALMRALMRRGLAELRLGRPDAAEATLQEAFRTFKDRDVQRLLGIQARGAKGQTLSKLIGLEVEWVELLDLRVAVALERLRLASLKPPAPGDDKLRGQVKASLDDLVGLERNAREARESLEARLALGGTSLTGSPRARAVASRFRPTFVAATKALAMGRLPPAEPQPAVDATGAWTETLSLFGDASRTLDAVIEAVAPKGLAAMKPELRLQVRMLQAELLVAGSEALLAAGEVTRARERLGEAIALREEAATLAKLPQPEAHPDLFWPLLLAAEAGLSEADRRLDAGDPAGARAATTEAAKLLARADRLAVPDSHPYRKRLTALTDRLGRVIATVTAELPGSAAADAAARRLERGLDATAASGAEF